MTTLIDDPEIEQRLIEDRRARGLDLWDEVWEGTYIIITGPNSEHQDILDGLIEVLRPIVRKLDLGTTRSTMNVSDRKGDWRENYRIPDFAFFSKESKAEDCDSFWFGGPDLAIEILSSGDRTREKFDFYTAVGTSELLLVNRDPWMLEQYARSGEGFELAGTVSPGDEDLLPLTTLPVVVGLADGQPRPKIHIIQYQLDVSELI